MYFGGARTIPSKLKLTTSSLRDAVSSPIPRTPHSSNHGISPGALNVYKHFCRTESASWPGRAKLLRGDSEICVDCKITPDSSKTPDDPSSLSPYRAEMRFKVAVKKPLIASDDTFTARFLGADFSDFFKSQKRVWFVLFTTKGYFVYQDDSPSVAWRLTNFRPLTDGDSVLTMNQCLASDVIWRATCALMFVYLQAPTSSVWDRSNSLMILLRLVTWTERVFLKLGQKTTTRSGVGQLSIVRLC